MPQRISDFRSDTITRPTAAMYEAMRTAPLGDDVLGDDPTVIELERRIAELLGKEAGLFVPTGTMSNNIAIRVQSRPGDEVLMDWDAHSMRFEAGAPAALSGVQTRTFRSVRGVPDVSEIIDCLCAGSLHSPKTALVLLENTHNLHGGAIIPLPVVQELSERLQAHGVPLHIDGARLMNAVVASGTPAASFAACADSVTICLSKGLCCPSGSVLCGTADFIDRARHVRKQFGGGMRQIGLLAACGLVALDSMIDRLAEDHRRARRLAEEVSEMPGMTIDLESVQTNMIYVKTALPAPQVAKQLEEVGVLCIPLGPGSIRLVTHHDITDEDIDHAIDGFWNAG